MHTIELPHGCPDCSKPQQATVPDFGSRGTWSCPCGSAWTVDAGSSDYGNLSLEGGNYPDLAHSVCDCYECGAKMALYYSESSQSVMRICRSCGFDGYH